MNPDQNPKEFIICSHCETPIYNEEHRVSLRFLLKDIEDIKHRKDYHFNCYKNLGDKTKNKLNRLIDGCFSILDDARGKLNKNETKTNK